MKILLLGLIVSAPVFAVKLVKQQASPLGVFSQGIEVTPGSLTYVRKSNVFDNKNDYRIGELTSREFEKVQGQRKKLEELLGKIKVVDSHLMKEEGTSFNAVAGAPGHEAVFLLDGMQIPEASKYALEVETIFQELTALKWTLVKGYELSADLTKVTEYEKGKPQRTVEYTKNSYCDRGSKICTYSGGGSLLIQDIH